jgi:hypothetical protein
MSQPDYPSRRRSQRVLLQVAVLIRTELADGKRVQVQAFTQGINAHGGLLESTVRLPTSQRITLVNPLTKKEIGCRVVRAEGISEESFAIAIEFDQPSPQFWAIAFPPKDWGITEDAAPGSASSY